MDNKILIDDLKEMVREFCDKRDWSQFHNPKDLSIGIITEASELLELFRFKSDSDMQEMLQNGEMRVNISEELSDILYFILRFSQMYDIDLSSSFIKKMKINEAKYPIEKSKGSNKKYTEDKDYIMASNIHTNYSCLGIDACEGKWIAVYISNNVFSAKKFTTIDEIVETYPDCNCYLIDIPIGLPESMNDLRPDSIIKRQLGKKGSSIFNVPCRQAIYAQNKTEARNVNIDIMGKSLSEQSLGISKAIRQIDEFLDKNPEWKNKLLESHPEFCFSKLNNNHPILENKKTPAGKESRLKVLSKYFPHANSVVEKFLSEVPYRKKTDDVIDALCLAIMGKEIMEKGLRTIPENPVSDSRGILMKMVYTE